MSVSALLSLIKKRTVFYFIIYADIPSAFKHLKRGLISPVCYLGLYSASSCLPKQWSVLISGCQRTGLDDRIAMSGTRNLLKIWQNVAVLEIQETGWGTSLFFSLPSFLFTNFVILFFLYIKICKWSKLIQGTKNITVLFLKTPYYSNYPWLASDITSVTEVWVKSRAAFSWKVPGRFT